MRSFRTCALAATLLVASICPAGAVSRADRATQAFDSQQSIALAVLLTQHALEQRLTQRLAFYHPISTTALNEMTDVSALRAQVIAAQDAAQISRDTIATMSTPSAQAAAEQLKAAIATALQGPLPATIGVPGTDMSVAILDPKTGTAKAVSAGKTNACKVASYVTSAYSAASPQFVTSAGSSGQKNTLSIAGFVLGIVPVAMACTDDHSTK